MKVIIPEWPAPANVHAVCTTRETGRSSAPWGNFNLAQHVGDNPQQVLRNRAILRDQLNLPVEPCWLEQTHGTHAINTALAQARPEGKLANADASYALHANSVCVVMTADCLPVLFTDSAGKCVAAAHAGWRGLLNGVLESTLAAMPCENNQLLAWLGPAIGPQAFEVGEEVREGFCKQQAEAQHAFKPTHPSHYLADIYQLARLRLSNAGVTQIFGGDYCTYSDAKRFYSYRRDGQTGRMASLIWINNLNP